MNNNNNDILFFKIFRNKFLLNLILSKLNTFNNYNLFYSSDKIVSTTIANITGTTETKEIINQNNNILEIKLKVVKKYDEIISVDWMIQNNLFQLLKYKLNVDENQKDKLIFTNKTVTEFCRKFIQLPSTINTLELFIEIYEKIKQYFIDESEIVLLQFIIGNRLDIIKYLLSSNLYEIKQSHITMSLNSFEILNYLLNDYLSNNNNGGVCGEKSKELKSTFYKNFLPSITSFKVTDDVKKNTEIAFNLYISTMDKDGCNETMLLGNSLFNIALLGDYNLFLKFAKPIGFYCEELFSLLLYQLLYRLDISKSLLLIGHLYILEYLRIILEKEGGTSDIKTKFTPFISTSNRHESELLNENYEAKFIENSNDEMYIFQFFILYFQESIESNYEKCSIIDNDAKVNDGRTKKKNQSSLEIMKSKFYFHKKAIDLCDLKSLKYLIRKYIYIPDSKCTSYLLEILTSSSNPVIFTDSRKEMLTYLLGFRGLSRCVLTEIEARGIFMKNDLQLFTYLWNRDRYTFQSYNPLLYAIRYSNFSFISSIYNDFGVRIEKSFTGIKILPIQIIDDDNTDVDGEEYLENLYQIIKFVNENIIQPEPIDFTFESTLLLGLLKVKSNDLKIFKYLLADGTYRYREKLLLNYTALIIAALNKNRMDILEYLESTIGFDKSFYIDLKTLFNQPKSDYNIRYTLTFKRQPHIDGNGMIETNNIQLYKLSSQYQLLPNKKHIVYSITHGHLEITSFLIDDFFKRSLKFKNEEKDELYFYFLKESIKSRSSISMIKLFLFELQQPEQSLSESQILELLEFSIGSKDFQIFKLIVDTFNLKDLKDLKNIIYKFKKNRLLTKSMSFYILK